MDLSSFVVLKMKPRVSHITQLQRCSTKEPQVHLETQEEDISLITLTKRKKKEFEVIKSGYVPQKSFFVNSRLIYGGCPSPIS